MGGLITGSHIIYISVQLSLIAIYLNLNLDCLKACRTAPNHSWKNPVERIMLILNVDLQCVGVMRSKASEEFQFSISNSSSVKEFLFSF